MSHKPHRCRAWLSVIALLELACASGSADGSEGQGQGQGGATTAGGASTTSSATASALPTDCGTNPCNATLESDPTLTDDGALGNVTTYSNAASNGGACLYGATQVMYYAAINVNLSPGDALGQWDGGRLCGQCFEVTVLTSEGTQQTVVRIMDKCPDVYCGIDLGGSAAGVVMLDGIGRYAGEWHAVSCQEHPEVFDGNPSLFVKDGSNPYWAVVQVRNPMMAVAAIDWQNTADSSAQGTLDWSDSIENYFVVPTTLLQASSTYLFTVSYVDGSTATATLTSAQLGSESTTYPLE